MGHRSGACVSRPARTATRRNRPRQRFEDRVPRAAEWPALRGNLVLSIPPHVAKGRTWSDMLGRWRGRADPAVMTADLCWAGAELLERASGAAQHLSSISASTGAVPALFASSPAAFAYVIGGAACGRPIAPLGPRLTAHELRPCIDNL